MKDLFIFRVITGGHMRNSELRRQSSALFYALSPRIALQDFLTKFNR